MVRISWRSTPHRSSHKPPAISFYVDCESQEEVDFIWERLSEEGKKVQCGWLQDKFGVSWQIIPSALGELLNDKDP